MKRHLRAIYGWILGASALVVIAWGGKAAGKLYLNNTCISTRVVWIDGRAYVPVNDLATALHGEIRRQGDSLYLDTVRSHSSTNKAGKSELKDGWIFSVNGVESARTYTEQYTRSPKALTPEHSGDRFIVIDCALQNDQKESIAVWIHEQYKAQLVDDQGKTYKPIGCDTAPPSSIWDELKPGSQKKFALIFSVPTSRRPATLRYQVNPAFNAPAPTFEISARP